MAAPAEGLDTAPEAPARPTAPATRAGVTSAAADGVWRTTYWIPRALYWGIHAASLLAFVTGVTPFALGLCATTLALRMFAITGGYHRYFAHKTYRTSRPFQFLLAFLACTATQKGPLWWAGNHRRHHRFADREGDVHSPKDGFWYSHAGWIFDGRWDDTPTDQIPDFARYPEIVWLNRWHIVPPLCLFLLCFALDGWRGAIWGYCVSTTVLWHFTYSINSLAHRWGTRRYDTPDTSRNNPLLALLTFGEGWHNNHHHYMASTRQGFYWWELDITYYVLRALAAVGLVWDLREPPAHVLNPGLAASEREAA